MYGKLLKHRQLFLITLCMSYGTLLTEHPSQSFRYSRNSLHFREPEGSLLFAGGKQWIISWANRIHSKPEQLHMLIIIQMYTVKTNRGNVIQLNHQPDATIFQFIILTFIYSSCFGRSPAHHQELNDCSSSLWFYLRIVVRADLRSWSGRFNRPEH